MPSRRTNTAASRRSSCTRWTWRTPLRSGCGDHPGFGAPLRTLPGHGLPHRPLAYLTDFKTIEDAEVEKLRGAEVLVVNALRFEPHYSHFNVEEALELIRRVAPREAYLTHMSHDIGRQAATEATLPPHVHMAYDTLRVEIGTE